MKKTIRILIIIASAAILLCIPVVAFNVFLDNLTAYPLAEHTKLVIPKGTRNIEIVRFKTKASVKEVEELYNHYTSGLPKVHDKTNPEYVGYYDKDQNLVFIRYTATAVGNRTYFTVSYELYLKNVWEIET